MNYSSVSTPFFRGESFTITTNFLRVHHYQATELTSEYIEIVGIKTMRALSCNALHGMEIVTDSGRGKREI